MSPKLYQAFKSYLEARDPSLIEIATGYKCRHRRQGSEDPRIALRQRC